jgi:hypothetical protein
MIRFTGDMSDTRLTGSYTELFEFSERPFHLLIDELGNVPIQQSQHSQTAHPAM